MSLGHGRPGLLSNLRTFADLMDDSAGSRRPLLEFSPADELARASWVNVSATMYKQSYIKVLDGMVRDVVGVEMMVGRGVVSLTRVESSAECLALPGSFFYDVASGVAPAYTWDGVGPQRWDDGTSMWDQGTAPDLYVNPTGGAVPTVTTLMAVLGFYYATRSEIHPNLGRNKIANASFDTWTNYSTPTIWTVDAPGGLPGNVYQEGTIVHRGAYSAKLLGSMAGGIGVGSAGVRIRQTDTVIPGNPYRFSGAYYYDPSNVVPDIEVRIRVRNGSAGSEYLLANGTSVVASPTEGFPLVATAGEWRRFVFDFIAPAGWINCEVAVILFNAGGGSLQGVVYLDDLRFSRVFRYNLYEPRLAADSLPDVGIASQSILFGGKTVGLGSVSIRNGDGVPERALAGLYVRNRKARVVHGGTFADGQEIYREDFRPGWPGLTSEVTVDDQAITFDVSDARCLLPETMPPNDYPLAVFPGIFQNKQGQPRPIGYGFSFVEPIRVDKDPTTQYGVYEFLDGSIGAAAVTDNPVDDVLSYPTAEIAAKELTPYSLVAGTHYQIEANNTRVRILQDVRSMRFDRNGNLVGDSAKFDFDIGGGTLTTIINMTGPANTFAAALQAALNATAATANITVAYSNTTHLWTVARGAGTLNLRGDTGPNSDIDCWQYLGYNHGDKTGSLSYVAEAVTFADADQDHVIRCLAWGYADDASGTITGVANGPIKKHAHIAYHLLNKVMGVPAESLNKASFDAAALLETGASTPDKDHGQLWQETEIGSAELLNQIETGLLADLVVDGDGVFTLLPYELVTTVAREFFDRDYLSWKMTLPTAEIYRRVKLNHGRNPNRGSWESTNSSDYPDVFLKHGANSVLERTTMIASSSSNASHRPSIVSNRLARLSAAAPRVVEFSARGKLVDLTIGYKVKLNRSRAFDPMGGLVGVVFRVSQLKHNYLSGVSFCTAIEDVPFLF